MEAYGMGKDIERDTFDEREYARFAQRLEQNLSALQDLLDRPGFGVGPTTVGAELELFLVDDAGRPMPQRVDPGVAPQILSRMGCSTASDGKQFEYIILGFPGKEVDGTVVTFEFDQLDELAPFAKVAGEVGGLLSADDIEYVESVLEPNSSAGLLVWEEMWATPLVEALREAAFSYKAHAFPPNPPSC